MKNLFYLCCAISFVCCSCSMQKRIHRPGYAIEWNLGKRIRHVHQQTARSKAPGNKVELAQAETTAGEFAAAHELVALNPSPENQQPAIAHEGGIIQKTAKSASKKSATTIHKSETTKEVKQYKPVQQTGDHNIIKGLLFILVALLLWGLGLIFASVLGLFGVILLLIFSIAALIFFVIGLIMMIVGLVG